MIRTLFDPEVYKRGIEQGRIEGRLEGRLEFKNRTVIEIAENLLKLGVSEDIIVQSTELSIETVRELKKKIKN